jgi:hypothetical protein
MMAIIYKNLNEECSSSEKPKVDIFTPAETIGSSFEGVKYPLDYPVFFDEDFRRFQDVSSFRVDIDKLQDSMRPFRSLIPNTLIICSMTMIWFLKAINTINNFTGDRGFPGCH